MSGWLKTLPSERVRAVDCDAVGDRHSQTFPSRREAKAFLTATLADLDRGHWIDRAAGSSRSPTGRSTGAPARLVRISTAASDKAQLRTQLLPWFGHLPLKDVAPLTVRSFVAQVSTKVAPKTVRNVHALLSTVLWDAVLEGLLLSNPCWTGGGAPLRQDVQPRADLVGVGAPTRCAGLPGSA